MININIIKPKLSRNSVLINNLAINVPMSHGCYLVETDPFKGYSIANFFTKDSVCAFLAKLPYDVYYGVRVK